MTTKPSNSNLDELLDKFDPFDISHNDFLNLKPRIKEAILANYVSKEELQAVLDRIQAKNDSNGRYNACMELRKEFGINEEKES